MNYSVRIDQLIKLAWDNANYDVRIFVNGEYFKHTYCFSKRGAKRWARRIIRKHSRQHADIGKVLEYGGSAKYLLRRLK